MSENNLTVYDEWIMNTATTNYTARPKDFNSVEEKYGYDTKEEYIEDDYGTIKFKRGRWYILKSDLSEEHLLWHQCEKDDWDLEEVAYTDYSEYADKPIIAKWRCAQCASAPPDSIVAVWCLMEPDFTSEQVQECINYPSDEEEMDIEETLEMIPGWDNGMSLDMWEAILDG